jgi:hypothetical protein
MDDVTSLSVHQCLTYLMFEKEKNDLEIHMIKRRNK